MGAKGRARLSGTGFTTATHTKESNIDDTESSIHGSRWIAPEVFKNCNFSKKSDVFAFGFMAAEVRSRKMPRPVTPIYHSYPRYSQESYYGVK